MSGYFKVWRGWRHCPALNTPERRDAWLWLVENACWKNTPFNINGKTVMLERGQICISFRQLASDWKWSKSAVDRFINRLKTETMIECEAGQGKAIITICNYAKYQDAETCNRDTSGTETGTRAGHERDIKEEGKKERKKEIYSPPSNDGLTVADVVEGWNDLAGKVGLSKVQRLTETRKRKVNAQLKRFGEDEWLAMLRKVASSPFLTGKKTDWRCDFDFILSEGNFIKILEGKYDRQTETH